MDALPTTMHAVLLTRHGGFDALSWRDDVPVPRPGPGEVLVRVAAAGVNNTDINTRIGWYARDVRGGTDPGAAATGLADLDPEQAGWNGTTFHFPRIQGADACGRIVAVGPGVEPSRIGERVLVEPVFQTAEGALYFGSERDGAFADYACVPSSAAHGVRSGLSDVELASFPCSASAAESMIMRTGVKAGEIVLVTGASGGVGSAAVQLAVRRGAEVIAIADPAKAAAVRALGAVRVLGRDDSLTESLCPASIDVVLDAVGGSTFPLLVQVLRPFGRYAVCGAIAGGGWSSTCGRST